MEMFWFLWLQFYWDYDSAYDSDFLFSQGHKRSYDSTYDSNSDSVATENQPLAKRTKTTHIENYSAFKDSSSVGGHNFVISLSQDWYNCFYLKGDFHISMEISQREFQNLASRLPTKSCFSVGKSH